MLRLLTPRDTKYHDAVKAYRPYNRLVKPLPMMRRESVSLIQLATAARCRAYVLVNNRTAGNAPRTIQALADTLHRDSTPRGERHAQGESSGGGHHRPLSRGHSTPEDKKR
jgi:hypothetical protein